MSAALGNVLVVYGSERGGTREIAETIGEQLVRHGMSVDVQPADRPVSPESYDGVVVCGAVYAGRWHPATRRFVRRHVAQLTRRPVWLVSSGPLGGSARTSDLQPTGVSRLAKQIGARGSRSFGGRLERDASGFLAGRMAKRSAGDWRDPEQVRAWADGVAAELLSGKVTAG